jgi:hypothetical protein
MSDGSTRRVTNVTTTTTYTTYTLDDGTQITIPNGTIAALSSIQSVLSSSMTIPILGLLAGFILITRESAFKRKARAS